MKKILIVLGLVFGTVGAYADEYQSALESVQKTNFQKLNIDTQLAIEESVADALNQEALVFISLSSNLKTQAAIESYLGLKVRAVIPGSKKGSTTIVTAKLRFIDILSISTLSEVRSVELSQLIGPAPAVTVKN